MYVKPEDVHSPLNRWKLIEVLYPGAAGTWAVAIGLWEQSKCLAVRWNGEEGTELGSPSARGNATWLVVDREFWEPILSKVPEAKSNLARSLLGI